MAHSHKHTYIPILHKRHVFFLIYFIFHLRSPKSDDGNCTFDDDANCEFYTKLYTDLTVDQDENEQLKEYFENNIPSKSYLIQMRANAFKVAVPFLSDDGDKEKNVALLRCINVILHNFELTCLW